MMDLYAGSILLIAYVPDHERAYSIQDDLLMYSPLDRRGGLDDSWEVVLFDEEENYNHTVLIERLGGDVDKLLAARPQS